MRCGQVLVSKNRCACRLFALLLPLITPAFICGDTAATKGVVAGVMENARKGRVVSFAALAEIPAAELLAQARDYSKDPDGAVRFVAARLVHEVALRVDTASVREEAWGTLVDIALQDGEQTRSVLNWFRASGPVSLARETKSKLGKALLRKDVNANEVLLAGYADGVVGDAVSLKRLNGLAGEALGGKAVRYDSVEWAALLALARSGDEGAVDVVVQRIRKDGDRAFRSTRLVEDLGYVRRIKAVQVLIDNVFSNKRIDREDGSPGPHIGCWSLSELSDVLFGFPIKKLGNPELYSDKDFAQAREWLKRQAKVQIRGTKESFSPTFPRE